MSWFTQFTGQDAAAEQQNAINRQQDEAKRQMNKYDQLLEPATGALTKEYQGALKDIYDQGRTQAAQSGLIGGFQEGQNTSPAIAALGRSFTSNLAQLRLSPYAQAAQNYTNTLGNYSQGANPLGSIIGAAGAVGGAATGIASLFGGGGGGVPGVNGRGSSGAMGTGQWQPPQMNFNAYSYTK